ncbi:glycosyltransferase 61 family protein [Tabrizicola flagellatus]|uniref:glycosyltransferase 61 family protein n=1 Tax=Tabrizicola flagellatus TaxID=2593021 RepID=UPI00135AB579|nr:glycosyltransferase 61 family protein [Tabrizicola flagellatus]
MLAQPMPPGCVLIRDAILVAGLDAAANRDGTDRPDRINLRGQGVRCADGSGIRHGGSSYRNRLLQPDTTAPLPQPAATLDGLSIFGGIAGPQFGHLVTQSLGRLTACDRFPEARLVFIAEQIGFDALPGYFLELLAHLGIRNPVQLVGASTRCEALILPQDLCNLERRPCVATAYRRWLDRFRGQPDASGGEDLYVSRGALGLDLGQFLEENVLETALRRNGYSIFHPETVPIGEQIRRYRAARRIIFADGSAAHLWSLFARPDSRAAVILRRPPYRHFQAWFRSAGSPKPVFLDFGLADLSSPGRPGATVGVLDMPAVWAALRDGGFHDDPQPVGTPRDRLTGWLSASGERTGRIPRPDLALDARSLALIAARRRFTLRETA